MNAGPGRTTARVAKHSSGTPRALMRGPSPTFMNEDILRRHDLDYVIDGSVTSSGGKYRFSVQLLNLTLVRSHDVG